MKFLTNITKMPDMDRLVQEASAEANVQVVYKDRPASKAEVEAEEGDAEGYEPNALALGSVWLVEDNDVDLHKFWAILRGKRNAAYPASLPPAQLPHVSLRTVVDTMLYFLRKSDNRLFRLDESKTKPLRTSNPRFQGQMSEHIEERTGKFRPVWRKTSWTNREELMRRLPGVEQIDIEPPFVPDPPALTDEQKRTFLSELKALLTKYDVSIGWELGEGSDTHGIHDEKVVIADKDGEPIHTSRGYSLDTSELP